MNPVWVKCRNRVFLAIDFRIKKDLIDDECSEYSLVMTTIHNEEIEEVLGVIFNEGLAVFNKFLNDLLFSILDEINMNRPIDICKYTSKFFED